ncbi:MAG: zf-HC2 domain-containing protein, partial [Clostridiales bacterium]|nr:zf-HC2 domain-containing protein [Clostridiales bacterium]
MKCNDFESQINRFFDNQLKTKELEDFLGHVNQCKACREELSI